MIGQDEREYDGSGLHTVKMKVRFRTSIGKGNRKGNKSVSIEKMVIHFTFSYFSCQNSLFSSIPFLFLGRAFLFFRDWIRCSLADKKGEQKTESLAGCAETRRRTGVLERRGVGEK